MALWGGRFSKKPTDAVFALSQSIAFDWRLAPYDLRSSLAHLAVLEKAALLSKDDAIKIKKAKVPKFRPGKALKDALN
jgi:argininosuccinate lyase